MLSVSKAQQGAQVNTGPCRKEGGEEHHILADYMKTGSWNYRDSMMERLISSP